MKTDQASASVPPVTAEPPPPHRYARHTFLAVSAVAFVAIVVVGRAVILPFLLAVLVAYVLFPAVKAMERIKLPRWVAILLVYAVSIGAMAGFGSAVVPRLFEETKKLSAELPKLTQRMRDDWLPAIDARLMRMSGVDPAELAKQVEAQRAAEEARAKQPPVVITPLDDGSFAVHLRDDLEIRKQSESSWLVTRPRAVGPRPMFSSTQAMRDAFDKAMTYARKNSLELLAIGRAVVESVSRLVFYFFITLMIAGYMMYTYERIHRFVRDMWPEYRRPAFDRFLHRLDRGMAGVIRGQLLICLVNGILSAIVFWIFDLKYWPILAFVAGCMSIIPIFGSILSSVPAVAIGLTQSLTTAIGVLVGIVAIHQLEANFLNPKIIGDQAKIHPVLVVFALLLGEHFYQITGALLAVPCLALVQAVFLHFRESVLGLPASRTSFYPPGGGGGGGGEAVAVATGGGGGSGTVASGTVASDVGEASTDAADGGEPTEKAPRRRETDDTLESPQD